MLCAGAGGGLASPPVRGACCSPVQGVLRSSAGCAVRAGASGMQQEQHPCRAGVGSGHGDRGPQCARLQQGTEKGEELLPPVITGEVDAT